MTTNVKVMLSSPATADCFLVKKTVQLRPHREFANSTQVDEGKKMLSSPGDENHGTWYTAVVGRGEERPLCDCGSELLMGGSGRNRARITNAMESRTKKKIGLPLF